MCRWGCTTTNTTYQCKWCGTRFCKECLRGDFTGEMFEAGRCRRCNQRKCQGVRVEYVPRPTQEDEDDKKGKGKGKGGAASRSRSKSPSKKGGKGSKKSGGKKGKKSGKKGGKKKKKKK